MNDPEKSSTGIMENKLLKFTIPKIKRDAEKVCIIPCMPEKREYADILDLMEKGRLNMNSELRSSWGFSEIKLVMNNDLERTFLEKRNEMKELGRNIRELEEKYCFLIVPYDSAATISNHGLSVGNMATKVLGCPHKGAYLFRHVDVALNFARQRNLTSNVVVVFKVLFGKVRKVHNVSPKKMALDPTPNYDSHVSKHPPIWNDPFDEQAKNSLIYVYEYDNSLKPVKTPRQCLPVALVTSAFLSQKTSVTPARLSSKNSSSGNDALANCTVAQRIGKGKDATVIFHSVRTPLTKPSLREISQNSSLQNEVQSLPILNRHQKLESDVPTPGFQNHVSLPNISMCLESLITSSLVISSKSIKDPRLLKRCGQEVLKFTGQCLLGQQKKKEVVLESEVSSLKEKDPSKENFGTLENKGSETLLYLSFEEARFADENYTIKEQEIKSKCIFDIDVSNKEDPNKERESWESNASKTSLYVSFEEVRFSDESKVKEQVKKTEEKQSSFLAFNKNVEDADQALRNVSMEGKSQLYGSGMSQTQHDNQLDVTKYEEPMRLISSLENTSTLPKCVNHSKSLAKMNEKSHVLQNKDQLLFSGIDRAQSENSDGGSPKQNQRDTLPKIVLNVNNEHLSLKKPTEDNNFESTAYKGALQNNQNSVHDGGNKLHSNSNRTKLGTTVAHQLNKNIPVKDSLSSSKEHLGNGVLSETCISIPDIKVRMPADQALENVSMEEKSQLCGSGMSQTLHDNQLGVTKYEEPMRLISSLEKTSALPRSVNHSKSPAKMDEKSNVLQNKDQLLSSEIDRAQSENSDGGSPKQNQRDTLPKIVLNVNNEHLSSKKPTEDNNSESTAYKGALQNNQNSVHDGGKKLYSNSSRTKLGTTVAHHFNKNIPAKDSLSSSNEHIGKGVLSETCISNPVIKVKTTADHTSTHKHLSTFPSCLNSKSPKAAEKCLSKKPHEKKEQHVCKKEKVEPITTLPTTSPKIMEEEDKHNAASNLSNDNGKNASEKPRFCSGLIHKVYNDQKEKTSPLHPVHHTTKQDKEVKRNCNMDLTAKDVHFNDIVVKSQTEKTRNHNSLTENNTFEEIHFNLLESRIDWKGIFGIHKEKAEELAELQKPSKMLREPSGLRIFPDMEITIRNSHYIHTEQDSNCFVEVHSSMSVKEKIGNNFRIYIPSEIHETCSVTETITEKTPTTPQDCKAAVDNKPELSHCVRMNESVHSDRKLTQKQDKYEVIDNTKLNCDKTGPNLSNSKIAKKKLSSTRRNSAVMKRSVRRMNKFSQSEKNIKVVLGLLSGEIPLCKSKRISKRLDRAILHLRKAHKRVQKSLQLVAKSGRRCKITETLQATENCGQENHDINSHNIFKIKRQIGKRIDTIGKQTTSGKAECRGEHSLKIPISSKATVSHRQQQSYLEDRQFLNLTTQVVNEISANDSLLAATTDNSPSPKKLPPSPPYRNSVGIATEPAYSPSASVSDIENAVPRISLEKSTSIKKVVSAEKCQTSKKDRKEIVCKKMLLQAKKYYSRHTSIKTSKKKTDSACETNRHQRKKNTLSTFIAAKNTEVSRLLLGKLSKILQNASEASNLKSLLDCRSLCRRMLPVFIKSFERKQKCSWRDVIIDRKLLFSHQLKTCFKSMLKPEAVECFLELQMMMETIQFIENRIYFIEGRPTFRSFLWYDGSLYRELLAGEAGYQQQSHFYTAFQEKLNDSAVTTLENLCSRLSEFLQEIDDKNSSFYVYLKYKRELKECEDVLKHDCDYAAFSLSIPFSCGAYLGNTVEDLVSLQKSTLKIISRIIQLPKVEPGKKEHALCLLEIISAKIDFLRTSVSLTMDLSLFGIQHLLFDAAKMMVFKEREALDKKKRIVFTKEIIGQINSNALSKLYEVFCVPSEEARVAVDIDELGNKSLNSTNNLRLSCQNDKFFVGKIIDQARHAKPYLLQQMILECQKHLDSQVKSFQILQECDIEKVLIKDSNVEELTLRKESLTTLIKAEAVEPYIELGMTYETLHFLNCLMASQEKQERKRGLLWFDTSLLSDLVKIENKMASFFSSNMMHCAIDSIESRIVDIKSELEVISNCSDSVNYAYAFQIMTRELIELSELKKMDFKLNSTLYGYIHFSPCVASLHYGSLSTELDYNYSQFSDFLGILMSSPKKDLGKMAHTMKTMKTIELAKALADKNNNSPFDLITCQILQNRMKIDCMESKTSNRSKHNNQSHRKRTCMSPETVSPKKKKQHNINPCEKSPGTKTEEKTVSLPSMKSPFEVNVSNKTESQSPVKKLKSPVNNDVKAFVSKSPKYRKKDTVTAIEINKSIQKNSKTSLASQHSLLPNKLNKSCSPNQTARSLVSTDYFDSSSNSKNQNQTEKKYSESLTSTKSDDTITNELSYSPAIHDKTAMENEVILSKLSEKKDVTDLEKSEIQSLREQNDHQKNPAREENQDINPVNRQTTQTNCDGWNKQPITSVKSLYPEYPGSSNPWQHSSYLWYQLGAHNDALSQTFPRVTYDAQNTNPYNQASAFSSLSPYSANQPYPNFMGQIQQQGYPATGSYGSTAPYSYSAPSSASNQNSVPIPYSYTSTMMAGWSWNSWQ